MKKLILGICFFSFVGAYASSFKVVKEEQVEVSAKIQNPVINPEGDKILYSTEDFRGLNLLDLSNLKTTEISTSDAAGYNAVFAKDGNVYFANSEMRDHLRYKNLMSYNCNSGLSKELVPMSRKSLKFNARNGKIRYKAGAKEAVMPKDEVLAFVENDQIRIEKNGKVSVIDPVEDAITYQWVTLSPEGDKILFTEPYKGVFTCNLDGSDLKRFGRGDNPMWLDNDFIVVTKSKDDGHFILEARLYTVNLNTRAAIALTDSDEIISASSVSAAAKKIAYTTESGKLMIVEYEIAE